YILLLGKPDQPFGCICCIDIVEETFWPINGDRLARKKRAHPTRNHVARITSIAAIDPRAGRSEGIRAETRQKAQLDLMAKFRHARQIARQNRIRFAQRHGCVLRRVELVTRLVIDEIARGKNGALEARQILQHRHEVMAEARIVPEVFFPETIGFCRTLESRGEVDEEMRREGSDFFPRPPVPIALPIAHTARKTLRTRLEVAHHDLRPAGNKPRHHFKTDNTRAATDKNPLALHSAARPSTDARQPWISESTGLPSIIT